MKPPAGKVLAAADLVDTVEIECDVCVIGTGAGGSVAAATLAAAGARVVMLEEGGHFTRRDFDMREAWAYPTLYQDHGNRATDDLSIIILQGRTVGGGTTVNWASCFRPPERTLKLWAERHQVAGVDPATLAPHLDEIEARLSVGPGTMDDVNANNRKLWEGADKLGWRPELIRRNVKQCARLGYCGLGCPLDAKRSALVTYVPDALAAGATLYSNCRVLKLERAGNRIVQVVAEVLDPASDRPRGARVLVKPARATIVAAGALNSPALLLRSGLAEGEGRVGARTFLHPAVPIVGLFPDRIEGFYGPPQSVACHEFAARGEKVGYLLETAPVHPMLASIALPGFGDAHRDLMVRLPHAQATIALLIDGHHQDPGGRVTCSPGGRMQVNYPLGPALVEAGRHALGSMARLLLAAGASEVVTLHREPLTFRNEADLKQLDGAPFGSTLHTLFSAHQMGGCAMGEDPARAVVNSRGRHHEIQDLFIFDGSVFPTALGVNPQLTIFALARLFATELAARG